MKPYLPATLPIRHLDPASLIRKLGEASRALAGYDGLLTALPNPALMLAPLTNQEAVLSSRIEGTQATVEEVFEFEAGVEQAEPLRQDIQEIRNYRRALQLGTEYLQAPEQAGTGISLWLIKSLHQQLMDSVRGETKSPGSFRSDQNWIGPPGCLIDQATFLPPDPITLADHLQDFERYLNSDVEDPLIQTAVMHAQFELLHPFKDGNGRVGRLLIPLFLYSKRLIHAPSFYVSAYLESNRQSYYAHLNAISTQGEWTAWVQFFLTAVTEQAFGNILRLKQIIALYDWAKKEVQRLTRSQYSAAIVEALFSRPIFRPADLADGAGLERPSIYPIIRKLEREGLIEVLQAGQGRRSGLYLFAELLNTVEGRKVV